MGCFILSRLENKRPHALTRNVAKWVAIGLSVFPGSLFVLALLNLVVCGILELNEPRGTANIGLGILYLSAIINVPTMIAWLVVGMMHAMDSN
jgi:uncharacterized membrane protein YgdD (TMEM256/DUF423 family)